jgi:hypothetical protein
LPLRECVACGHSNTGDYTYCERCGAALDPKAPGFSVVAALLGGFLGIAVFVIFGTFVTLASGPNVRLTAALDFGIVVLLGAIVFALARAHRLGSGFLVAMLVVILGGFAVCGGLEISWTASVR